QTIRGRGIATAGSRQVLLGKRGARAAARPDHVEVVIDARDQRQDAAVDLAVRAVAVRDLDRAVFDFDLRDVLAALVAGSRNAEVAAVDVGTAAAVSIQLTDTSLQIGRQVQTFRDLRADRVVLVSGNGDGRQDA